MKVSRVIVALLLFVSCSDLEEKVSGDVEVKIFTPDLTSLVRNPLSGWTIYDDANGNVSDAATTDTEGRLVASGTFDCTAEDVSDAVTGSKGNIIKVEPKRSLRGGYWVSTYIMMPPVYGLDLASNEMKLSFVFNNISAETEFYLPSTMKNSSVPVTEFERGYKYIYELKLDNTMDFRPVGIEKQWQTQTITLPI